ncbi:hypothetical protein BKA62DRAFT_686170 [Auriculariales sp. MPI-PUGE-AT-0066]|nr:hypothetical protein BKA62DRAFT_686170 [Auriculariales sp. MPI-PUGE-AT-0066]
MHLTSRLALASARSIAPSRPFSHCLRRAADDHPSQISASAKLWQDAREEELKLNQPSKADVLLELSKEENWTGEERTQDAVLRMLVDKYQPLRGPIRSADEKLKDAPPEIITRSSTIQPSSVVAAPDSDEHRPWLVSFKPPSFMTTQVRADNFASPAPSKSSQLSPLDDQPKDREQRRRAHQATRLTSAREATLDYRLRKPTDAPRARPNSLKGWQSLVEERIERARNQGQFKIVSGRGQPLAKDMAESNPFIAREEFLMNRIVQRQGAAPLWVELQAELDQAISSFRKSLQQSWVRTASRGLSETRPRPMLALVSRDEILAFRDASWEARERSFHEAAVNEVNRVVRKHNGIAPTTVRKGYLMREVELHKCYEASVDDISEELARRAQGLVELAERQGSSSTGRMGLEGSDEVVSIGSLLRKMIRGVVQRFVRPL